jgi:hypothetical protein
MNTNELTGPALDWAVAKCLPDENFLFSPHPYLPDENGQPKYFDPSTDWSQGGPIIEREAIGLMETEVGSGEWEAFKWLNVDKHMPLIESGPTPLIAAMRCFVASRLGDEVDVHDDIL